jgi:acyl-CoA synthetase (AMP-forming)/AMP-acid ligase II
MIETADISYCLTPAAQMPQPIVASFPELTALAVYDNGLVEQSGALLPAAPERVPDAVRDSATAYVLFTSGSTGKPKGCMVPHRGSALYAHAVVKSCCLDKDMTFLLKTPYVFDVSIQDIYTAFSAAGTLVIAEPGAHKDAEALAALVAVQGINCMAFTPTLLVEFVNHLARNLEDAAAVAQTLNRVLTIGEALMAATCKELFELIPGLDGEIHNLYGPTEASVGVSHFQVSTASLGQSVVAPIGVPFDYVEFRCFDPALYEERMMTPEFLIETQSGQTGELFIGGDCLAHGYLKNPEKTDAAFFDYPQVLARPESAASRFSLYKTGDLVRCRSDGVFEILGRNDFQVKIGGVRIECEEIGAVLKTHPSVDDALVTVFDGPFGKILAAYVVSRECPDWLDAGDSDDTATPPSKEDDEEIRRCNDLLKYWVGGTSLLPVMRPKVYIPLAEFPKNAAGKTDRGVLPDARKVFDQLSGAGGDVMITPETEEERAMAKCWETVLKRQVCVETSFAAYGGHSLMALTLRSEIAKTFGVFPNAALIMSEECTVRRLVNEVKSGSTPMQERPKVDVNFPFTCEKSFHTFFHMEGTSVPMYRAAHAITKYMPEQTTALLNFYFVPTLEIDLDRPLQDLEGMVAELIRAHPILRARYNEKQDIIIPAAATDAAEYCSWDQDLRKVRQSILKMYDCPLFHIIAHRSRAWHRHGPAHRVTVVWHHIVMDTHSEQLIKRDILALLRGESLVDADLSLYHVVAQHSAAKPRTTPHPFNTFSLPRTASCSVMNISGSVAHTVTSMVAVSRRPFTQGLDKVRFFLDAFCEVTGQLKGRCGLVTNARTHVDRDASNLMGALLYNLEYSYDSTSGELLALGCSLSDGEPSLAINMHPEEDDAMSIISRMGFKDPEKALAGVTENCIKQNFVGACGVNFAKGTHLYVECLEVSDATLFTAIYSDALFDGLETMRALHERLSDSDSK